MDCRQVEFSPEKSQERIEKALRVFPGKLLMRILAFALHLLGAKRKVVAALVGLPEESVKTALRLVLHDRRLSEAPVAGTVPPTQQEIAVCRNDAGWIVELGVNGKTLSIPATHRVQARAVVLSLLNAGALSVQQCASALGISTAHCRALAHKLEQHDVGQALVDKRDGQKRDYRVGPALKAELIEQLAARAITGHDTSSAVLAEQVNERTHSRLSARTIRWHIRNLGLGDLRRSLPQLVETLKKTPADPG